MTSVKVPNSVKTIGEYAFVGCSGLNSVKIGNSVKTIGTFAFLDCSGLKKAEFASIETLCNIDFGNFSSNPLNYAHRLYIKGEEVTELAIPESVTTIGNYAFYAYTELTSVKIPNSVLTIGSSAFYGCSGLKKAEFTSIEALCNIDFRDLYSNPLYLTGHLYINGEEATELVIPESVTKIGTFAFIKCSSLTSVTIPNSVTYIGRSAFNDCSNLKKAEFASIEALCKIDFRDFSSNPLYHAEHLYINGEEVCEVNVPDGIEILTATFVGGSHISSITLPNSLKEITGSTFYNCESISSIIIPNSVTTIGNNAFSNCYGLNSIVIPNSVTSIGWCTFSGCNSLNSIVIPNSVTSIGWYTFSGCNSLNSVIYNTDQPISVHSDIFNDIVYQNADLVIPEGAKERFMVTEPWNRFNKIIEKDLGGIEDVVCDTVDGEIDYNAPYEVYILNGTFAGNSVENLSSGIYIVRQGRVVKKIAVK